MHHVVVCMHRTTAGSVELNLLQEVILDDGSKGIMNTKTLTATTRD